MARDKRERFLKRFCDPLLKRDLAIKVLVALNGGRHPVSIAWGNGQFGFTGTIALDPAHAVGGRGSEAVIFIDERAPDWQGLETIVAHPDVGLFHELVPALYIQAGAATADEAEMERRVIGIGSSSNCRVTENAYREAKSLPLRCCRNRERL
jgi:hypothetical protein